MKIELIESDITTLAVDAIVNAANSQLAHGGGVAGAIVRRGGSIIQEESNRIGFVPVGEAAVTTGGNLPCTWVIHAVGPIMGEGDEDEKLERATRSALARAEELELRSVAFPAISTGVFGYPVDRCAKVMLSTVLAHQPRTIERVVFCLFGGEAFDTFASTFEELTRGG